MSERLTRKCRSCGKWNTFAGGEDRSTCPACRTPYGKVELGLDRFEPSTKGRKR
jgi:hypothetical protein